MLSNTSFDVLCIGIVLLRLWVRLLCSYFALVAVHHWLVSESRFVVWVLAHPWWWSQVLLGPEDELTQSPFLFQPICSAARRHSQMCAQFCAITCESTKSLIHLINQCTNRHLLWPLGVSISTSVISLATPTIVRCSILLGLHQWWTVLVQIVICCMRIFLFSCQKKRLILTAVVMAIRTYALYGRSRCILVIFAIMLITAMAVNGVCTYYIQLEMIPLILSYFTSGQLQVGH